MKPKKSNAFATAARLQPKFTFTPGKESRAMPCHAVLCHASPHDSSELGQLGTVRHSTVQSAFTPSIKPCHAVPCHASPVFRASVNAV